MKAIDFKELQKRFQSRAALAISLETREVSVAVLRREGAHVRAGESFSLPLGAEAVLADPEKVGNALTDALENAKVRERRCVVCLPCRWALSATVELPDVTGEDLQSFIEIQAEKEFSTPLADLQLSHSVFTTPDGKKYATLAAVSNRRLETVRKMLEVAGCRAASISLGLDRVAKLGAKAPSLEFLANCDHVDLLVATGGSVSAMRTLPGPSQQNFDAPNFFREVRITLGRLPAELRRTLDSARFAGPEESVSALMSAGGDPLRRLGISRLEAEPAGASAHPAIDAASEFLLERPVLFDLVTRETSPWQAYLGRFDGKQQRLILIAVVALVILPFLILVYRAHKESSLDEEWQAMRGQVAELDGIQQRIRQFRPWYDPVPQNLQCMETLAGCFPENGDIWARNIQISEAGKVTVTGLARRQEAFFALRLKIVSVPGVSGFTFQLHNDSVAKKDTPGSIQFTLSYQWDTSHGS